MNGQLPLARLKCETGSIYDEPPKIIFEYKDTQKQIKLTIRKK